MGKLFIVAAPSGAGKTTLVTSVIEKLGNPYKLSRVITYTTKIPRPQEAHGKDYYFVSIEQFEQKIEEGFFLEWSLAYGHYYGSPRTILQDLEQGQSYIMILDVQGAMNIYNEVPGAVLIAITVPNIEILRQRLLGRNAENSEQIDKRILIAQKEIDAISAQKTFRHKVYNEIFQSALLELEMIIKSELKKP